MHFIHVFFLLISGMLIATGAAAQDFLHQWDFDRDGKVDTVFFEYTGGAHCCYHIRIKTSHDQRVWKFDDDMDGGYIRGVDNSQPDHFNIMDYDGDSVPEIFMKLNSYNGEEDLWTRRVLLDYENGVFVQKSFDMYAYDRTQDSITCSGLNAMGGLYISRSEDKKEMLLLRNNSAVEYDVYSLGTGRHENHYNGQWKRSNDTLTVTYLAASGSKESDTHQTGAVPVIRKFIFVKEKCMFVEIGAVESAGFYRK